MEPAIEADGLVKSYPKGVTALDGLSFAVAPGRVYALLGQNGAGKSTAVKILTTLAKPDAGAASVAGIDVTANPDRVRRTIGVVAQGSAVDVQATGRENLRLCAALDGGEAAARIDEVLDVVEMRDRAKDRVGGYSHGMRQRLGIAAALLRRPRLLLLDEPATGLDPGGMRDMRS